MNLSLRNAHYRFAARTHKIELNASIKPAVLPIEREPAPEVGVAGLAGEVGEVVVESEVVEVLLLEVVELVLDPEGVEVVFESVLEEELPTV